MLADNLIPMTRWITPASSSKRFTTQMYLYLLPLESLSSDTVVEAGAPLLAPANQDSPDVSTSYLVPMPDGGIEHTEALFDEARTWLRRSARPPEDGGIIMFPPQAFLLNLVARFFCDSEKPRVGNPVLYASQRRSLLEFLSRTPTDTSGKPEALVPWQARSSVPSHLAGTWSDQTAASCWRCMRREETGLMLPSCALLKAAASRSRPKLRLSRERRCLFVLRELGGASFKATF